MQADADVESIWVAALLDEQIDDPMHTTLSEKKLKNYGKDVEIMMKIVGCEIKSLIEEKVDRMQA